MMDRGKLVKAMYLGNQPVTLAYKGTDPVVIGNDDPPPFPAPNGLIWPTQVNPVTYDRDVHMIWGQRYAGADPAIQDKGRFRVTVPRKTWAFDSSDNNEIRAEVRHGDQYSDPSWTDAADVNRAELQNVITPPVAGQYFCHWESYFEGDNNSPWAVIMQCFARNASGQGLGSPPVALTYEGDNTLHLITRTDIGGSPKEDYRYSWVPPRNTWIDLYLEFFFSRTGTGFARLYSGSSTLIEANNINIGYSGQVDWETTFGIYRKHPSSGTANTFAHRIRNLEMNF